MKHIRPDKTFVYYYFQMADGTLAGIRVDRTHVSVIEGPDPEQLSVHGEALKLPVSGETSEGFKNVKGQLVDQHPELKRYLAGEISYDKLAYNSN